MRLFHDIVAQPAEGIEKDHHTKISARISLQQMYTTFVQQQVQQQQQTQPKKRSLLPIVDIAEFDTTIGDNEESAVSDSSSIIPNSTTSGCNDPPLCSEVNSYSTNNRGSSLKALDVLTNLIAIASTPTKQQIQNHSTIDSDLVGNEQGQGGTIPLFPSLMLPEEQISGSDCDSDSSCKDSSMSTKGSLTDLRACDSDSSSLSTPRSHSPQTPPIALFENLSPIDNFTSKNGYVNELAMLCRSPSKCRASATVLSEDPSSPKAAAVWATLTLFGPRVCGATATAGDTTEFENVNFHELEHEREQERDYEREHEHEYESGNLHYLDQLNHMMTGSSTDSSSANLEKPLYLREKNLSFYNIFAKLLLRALALLEFALVAACAIGLVGLLGYFFSEFLPVHHESSRSGRLLPNDKLSRSGLGEVEYEIRGGLGEGESSLLKFAFEPPQPQQMLQAPTNFPPIPPRKQTSTSATTTPTTNSFFELINNWENVVKETKAALKANVVKSGDSIVGEGVKSGRVLLRTTKKRVHTLSSEMIDSIKANPQYLSLRERGIWGNRENSATPIFEQEFKLVPFNELLGEEDDPPLVDVFMNYLKKIIEKQSNKRPLTS